VTSHELAYFNHLLSLLTNYTKENKLNFIVAAIGGDGRKNSGMLLPPSTLIGISGGEHVNSGYKNIEQVFGKQQHVILKKRIDKQ
jgi:hypothetical protein